MGNLDTWSLHGPLPRLKDNVPPESLLEDVKSALHALPTETIKGTNKLMYTTAVVVLEMLGHKINSTRNSKGQYPPCR